MLPINTLRRISLRAAVALLLFSSLLTAAAAAAAAAPGEQEQEHEWRQQVSLSLSDLNERRSWLPSFIIDNTSSCSVEHGCPQASMVWATGTFTLANLLTPASFFVASNLTLKMSLCCGYKYNGLLLRDAALYDVFLRVLLEATPFHMLTPEEKRRMFPIERVVILDTGKGRRYDTAYILTGEDVLMGNDGDGDVIVLVSGAVGDAIHGVPLQHSSGDHADDGVADVQLKIANTAIKCKCPHTLRVMPILRAKPDSLPQVSIIGLGSHCGVRVGRLHPNGNTTRSRNGNSNNDGKDNNIVRLRDGVWGISFALSSPLLPATLVRWVVSDTTLGSVSVSASAVVLDESFHIRTEMGNDGTLLLQHNHANSSYFRMLPHHRYEVRVTVSRGILTQTDSGTFVMQLPFVRHWEAERVAPRLHFGFERRLRLSEGTMNHVELKDALLQRHAHSPTHYIGYWVNTPSNDQPLPQSLHRVEHNPYAEDSVVYPLFVGQNIISFYVSDVDEVCDPTLIGEQEFWALQSILLSPSTSPVTACRDDIALEALSLSRVVSAMRFLHQLPVRFSASSQDVEGANGVEGRFECTERGAGPCHIRVAEDIDGGVSGVLQMRKRSVVELAWVVRVEVNNNTALSLHEEDFDPMVARVVGPMSAPVVLVEVLSRAAVVVRRMSTLPERVRITLPMHERRLVVHPPHPVENEGGTLPLGRWVAAAPLRVVSVDDAFVAVLDTTFVPNVQQTLEEGTLRFIAEDFGEPMSDSTHFMGAPYTSRCPPRIVEHTVVVVAVAAPPILPALVPVYTEESCVRLQAPRRTRKDEDARWHILHCEEAGSPPQLVLQQQQQQEQEWEQEWGEDAGDATSTRDVTMVCGIEAQRWCNVSWRAENPVGAVTQTFSLRRCQQPPKLVFHKDGLQQSRGAPSALYVLPLIEWLINDDEDTKEGADATAAAAAGARRYTALRIIPIAGYEASIGYSFDHAGLQHHFEAEFTYTHSAAHQLQCTQKHFQRARGADASGGYGTDQDDAATVPPLFIRRSIPALDGGDDDNSSSSSGGISSIATGGADDDVEVGTHKTQNSDRVIDLACDARFSLSNRPASRQLQLRGLSNSSHYPLMYVVRTLPTLTDVSPIGKEAAAEFSQRGMCVERPGAISVLSLTPLGMVQVFGEREVPFCESTFVFSRHPWLHTKFHFDFTWSCADDGVIMVTKQSPTLSVLRHGGGDVNTTHCSLSVHNTLTDTTQTDRFILRRVYPTALSSTFVVLSDNAATGECVTNARTHAPGTSKSTTSAAAAANVAGNPTTKRWIVGSTAILHVDTPDEGSTIHWRALTVVTAEPTPIGTQVLLDSIQFLPLEQHAVAPAWGSGGATVMVTGIRVPGLYTLSHSHLDPKYPNVCPNASITETLHVARAQLVERELTVFGDTTVLAAVPLPREVECQFVGRWEVVSRQTSENEILEIGSNLTSIRIDSIDKPRTRIHGLPFGIVTMRWAIYAITTVMTRERGIHKSNGNNVASDSNKQQQLVLVDHDTLRILVLTENLHSNRLVTLSHTVEILPTFSTLNWVLTESQGGGASGFLPLRGASLRVEVVPNRNSTPAIAGTRREVIVVENLPIGVTHMQYELHPSPRIFGPMLAKKFPSVQRQRFEIERVSAFLSVNTTLNHECDAYSGDGRISICLHASGVTLPRFGAAAAAEEEESPSPLGVRLVAPDLLESTVKAGAGRLVAHGCSVPWWVTPEARWFDIHADASQRCVSFAVVSSRHMHPKELSHHLFLAQERVESSRPCAHNDGDFMTSEIIEGAATWIESAKGQEPMFRLSDSSGSGIMQFLPFRDPATLAREERVMRPMFGLLGVPDVVATELDISKGDSGNSSKAVVVVLRLDLGDSRQMGGFFPRATRSEGQQEHQVLQHDSLLTKCVRDTVRGSDILQYWTEVNRPDGVEGRTAREWVEYVGNFLDTHVSCEPLFLSLGHLLPRLDDTEETLQSRRAYRLPSTERPLVTLDVVAQQLDGLRQEFRWTHDGINVTGLRADLQEALSRRRVTKSQLKEIGHARVDDRSGSSSSSGSGGGGGKQKKPKLSLSYVPDGSTREELFEAVMRLYKGVTDEDVSAIRVTLPRHARFTVPHNLFLRTALHKNVLCGTKIPSSAASLVWFGRVELLDVPPLVSVSPSVIKQCELESGVPVIDVNLSGTMFANLDPFPMDRVLLEEVQNPNRAAFLAAEHSPDVGLMPCLKQLQAGMRVTMSPTTRKHLYIQLSPCPSFQMLSPAEYDEHQDSAMLQQKLQHPRLLRITLRDLLMQDSHTEGKTSVSFVIEVRPTMARLHLRMPSPSDESQPWLSASRGRPLLVCESDLQRKGMELGVELIGDRWHERVGRRADWGSGEESDLKSAISALLHPGAPHQFDPAVSGLLQHWVGNDGIAGAGLLRWSPHDVALLNSFSIVEHHALDSAHHIFLRHGGLYRSHFVSYLFSTLLTNPDNIQRHQFVRRYNSTFVGIRIPAGEPNPKDSCGNAQDNDLYGVAGNGDNCLPSIRPFAIIEEILFAVPGISTECRGCLLSDTTYFVAGDLTGLWSFPPATLPPLENSRLTGPLRVPFYEAPHVPRKWRFTTICPAAAWENLNRLRRHWPSPRVVPDTKPFLQMEVVVYNLRDMLGEEVPLSRRPTTLLSSVPIPVADLVQDGQAKEMDDLLLEIVFNVNKSVAERAHAMLAADFVRYGRRHLHTVHDYVRDDEGSGGALAVNASVFLKFCVHVAPATTLQQQQQQQQRDSQCSVVSLTHSLLIVEEPRVASYYGRLRSETWGSTLHPAVLLHHAGTALLGYFIFPRVPWMRRKLMAVHMDDMTSARSGVTLILFVAAVFLYQMMSWLWAMMWVLLWGTLFCLVPEIIVGVYFVLHLFLWAFVM